MSFTGLLRSPVELHVNMAGLVCVSCGPWSLHLFVRKRHWTWGKMDGWWDGPTSQYGLGPLFMLNGFHPDSWCYFCDDDRCMDQARHGYF